MIRDTLAKKSRIETEEDIKTEDHADLLQQLVEPEQWRQLKTWCSTSDKRVYTEAKARQISRFERLTLLPHWYPKVDMHTYIV